MAASSELKDDDKKSRKRRLRKVDLWRIGHVCLDDILYHGGGIEGRVDAVADVEKEAGGST